MLNKLLGLFGLKVVKIKDKRSSTGKKPKKSKKTKKGTQAKRSSSSKPKMTAAEYTLKMIEEILHESPLYFVQNDVGYRVLAISFPPMAKQTGSSPDFKLCISGEDKIAVMGKTSDPGFDDSLRDVEDGRDFL